MTAVSEILTRGARFAVDFALPPRCGGCGTIVAEMHIFCSDCWHAVSWCGDNGCEHCGLPLQATEETTCGKCQAQRPLITRTRAVMEYGDLARTLMMKMKYGRKVGAADKMAALLLPLAKPFLMSVLVPVPLHRGWLWAKGFNQSVLIAKSLSNQLGIEFRADLIKRIRQLRPLRGMGVTQRNREVARAFAVPNPKIVEGPPRHPGGRSLDERKRVRGVRQGSIERRCAASRSSGFRSCGAAVGTYALIT